MKKILIILDGIVAKKLMHRIVESNTGDNAYDVVYMNDLILPIQKPSNFTFYKFDPTSKSKLAMVLDKDIHSEVLMALNSKDEMLSVIKNIREHKQNMPITILDYWGIKLNDPHLDIYKGIEVLANGMVEKLPNVPVVAQNIGLKQGEIMEIRVPFGSSYAYRYVGSIEQKEWKIFALYRNQKLMNIKPSLVLKPNDVILVIGKPEVLMQVYNAIGKTQGQFPMPFGNNIYLYLDLYLQKIEDVKKAVEEAKFLNQKLKNRKLIVRITRPTTVDVLDYIKSEFKYNDPTSVLMIDYANKGFAKIVKEDFRKSDVGAIILTKEMFRNRTLVDSILNLKVPIFKLGNESLKAIKRTGVILNDKNSYQQISPIVFDVATQLKTKIKLLNLDPIGQDDNKNDLVNHFENLSKIFNEKIEVVSSGKNPIREFKKEKNILHILPLRKLKFKKRNIFGFLNTNSDFIAFNMTKYNQLLVPIVEE